MRYIYICQSIVIQNHHYYHFEKYYVLTHVSSMYFSEPAAELTEKFLKTFPTRSDGEKWKVQYLVSGGEAVEMAIQMSRVTTGAL